MKLRITLTKPEYKALAIITNNLIGLIREETDLEYYSYLTALEELALRFLPNLHAGTVKKKQSVTLTDMQTLAMFHLLNVYVPLFFPYESAFSCHLIKQIDLQHKQESTARMAARQTAQHARQALK